MDQKLCKVKKQQTARNKFLCITVCLVANMQFWVCMCVCVCRKGGGGCRFRGSRSSLGHLQNGMQGEDKADGSSPAAVCACVCWGWGGAVGRVPCNNPPPSLLISGAQKRGGHPA